MAITDAMERRGTALVCMAWLASVFLEIAIAIGIQIGARQGKSLPQFTGRPGVDPDPDCDPDWDRRVSYVQPFLSPAKRPGHPQNRVKLA